MELKGHREGARRGYYGHPALPGAHRAGAARSADLSFPLPELKTAGDAVKAASAILTAVAAGEITPGEAAELGRLVESFARTIEVSELEDRISRLKDRTSQ